MPGRRCPSTRPFGIGGMSSVECLLGGHRCAGRGAQRLRCQMDPVAHPALVVTSDEESGEAITATPGYIALIESGKRIPTETFMAALERALDLAAGSLKESRSQALVERIDGDFVWSNPDGGVTIIETKKWTVDQTSEPSTARFSMPMVQYGKELTEWMLVVMERARGLTEADRQRVIGYIDALRQDRGE